MRNDSSELPGVTGWIATTVSGVVRYVIAIIDLLIMAGIRTGSPAST
ncbi:hypothetical protein [Streptomyces sp. NPDC005385]